MNIPREFSRLVRIGSGSFSTVYRAFQSKLERSVVLKTLSLTEAKEPGSFEQEIRVLASMHLPCVPHIYDVVRMRKEIIIVMEWVRGIPLSSLLEHDLTVECKMAIASAIIGSLALLHTNNVSHCDLKPENILITSDFRIFFVDFGFSRQSTGSRFPDVIQGTPAFMAPELWSNQEKINFKKVDLYALGVLLSRLLGNAMPSFATELTASDPELRPCDGVSFEKIWRANCLDSKDLQLPRLNIVAAVDEYTARMLLSGARELHAKGRSEEAYALLTESLDIWPDNTEALEYLQNKFSTPITTTRRRRTVLITATSLGIVVAVFAAYLIGTQSSVSPDIIGNLSVQQEETRFISLLSTSRNTSCSQSTSFVLREIAGSMNLTGTIKVSMSSKTGSLFVDGNPITDLNGSGVTLLLKIGTHRIEWLDSTSLRRFGETVEVLPFEKKTVSLKRFINGKRS